MPGVKKVVFYRNFNKIEKTCNLCATKCKEPRQTRCLPGLLESGYVVQGMEDCSRMMAL